MPRRDATGYLTGAVVVVALVLAGVALAVWRDPGRSPSEPDAATTDTTAVPDTDPVAAAAFVDAWQRSRTGTFVVDADYRQERAGAVFQEGRQRTVQRPPDRLVFQFDGVDGRLGGEVVGCAPGPDDQPRCRHGGAAVPYDQEVATEVALLRTYVEGPTPLYDVQAGGDGCFDLSLARAMPVAPYGEHARFCFDEATGAPVHQEVTRGDVVDRTVATAVRAPADDDLVLPGPFTS